MARLRWTSRTVFILAAVGSAVGLGNIWRFPYLAGKYGGGAFLIPYLIALFVVGVPLLTLEFAVGQRMQQGAVGSFRRLHPHWGGLGLFALISSFIIVSYYAVVMAWSLLYAIFSFTLPWTSYEGGTSAFFAEHVLEAVDTSIPSLGGINWMILAALAIVWIMIYFCVWKGVKSVGKVVWITVPLPVLLLVVLLIRAVTLDGFLDGWAYYLVPDLTIFADAGGWLGLDWAALGEVFMAAFSQIFFTLTLGFGVMVAYSSYKREKDDVARDAWTTAMLNSAISLFAGFVVFGVLGYMATQTATPVAELASEGVGLAFMVFPEALSLLPAAPLFALIFFLTLLSLGIDSAFSLVEAVSTGVLDWKRKQKVPIVAGVVCSAAFVIGILFTTRAGLYLLDIIDHFVNNFNLVLVGLLQCILVGWAYGAERMRTYINEVSDVRLGRWWSAMIRYVIPIVLALLLVRQFWTEVADPYGGYPSWALASGWFIVAVPLAIFVVVLVVQRRSSEA